MNKEVFLEKLKELLSDLPDDENKLDALGYYQSYLEEAGDDVGTVLREFGSPERIASIIRCELTGDLKEGGEFTERGYEDERFKNPGYDAVKRLDLPDTVEETTDTEKENAERVHTSTAGDSSEKKKKDRKSFAWWQIVLIALVLISVSPFLLGGVLILSLVALGILLSLPGLLVSVALGTILLFFFGVVMLIEGIGYLAQSQIYGLWPTGIGFLTLAGAILMLLASILFYGKLVPKMFAKVINGINRFLHRKGREN